MSRKREDCRALLHVVSGRGQARWPRQIGRDDAGSWEVQIGEGEEEWVERAERSLHDESAEDGKGGLAPARPDN